MTRTEGLKRSFPVLFALILVAVGWWAGQELAAKLYLSVPQQCDLTAGRFVTGGLGALTTIISALFGASKDGFLHLGNLLRFIRHGHADKYHWFFDGGQLGVGALALSGLLSFSYDATFGECAPPSPPSSPPSCASPFQACQGPRTEADCRLCNVQEEVSRATQAIRHLHLQRVGAFPLLFGNAGTVDGDLTRGVHLAPDQLPSWHRTLFSGLAWPVPASPDVAYCVVGYSSTAQFQGKSRATSNDLNVQAARCRADSVATEFVAVLNEAAPQIASCGWSSYKAMQRPSLRPDGHLATPDKQLISRSAFVHGFPLSPPDSSVDIGAVCGKLLRKKLGVKEGELSCSTVDGIDGNARGGALCSQPTGGSLQ